MVKYRAGGVDSFLMSRKPIRSSPAPPLAVDDRGITTIELLVAMVVTALIAGAMMSWIMSVSTADDRFKSNDYAMADLRDISDQLSRDLRSSEYLTVAGPDAVSFWLDADRNDVVDTGETLTWSIESDGTVVRATDSGVSTVVATRIDPSLSFFAYDAGSPQQVSTVTIELVALSPSGDTNDELRYASKVFLRNS